MSRSRDDGGGGQGGVEAPSWFGRLAPGTREALTDLYELDRRHNWVVAAFLAIWAGTYAAMVAWPHWPVRLIGYAIIGAVLHAFGVLVHEAVHGNFFRDRTRDRWAAFLLGIPTFLSGEAYRVSHLVHHRHTREPADPDDLEFRIRDPRLRSIAFYLLGLLGLFVFLVHVPHQALRHGSREERRRVLLEYGALAALYAVVVALAVRLDGVHHLLHGWLLPGAVTVAFVNVRGWAEHLMTRPGDPLTRSRTVTSNPVVGFLMCNVNYHLEHHLLPAVPWYNLPRMHELMREPYREAGAFVYDSYLRFLWDALRTGVHGLAPSGEIPHRGDRAPPDSNLTPRT